MSAYFLAHPIQRGRSFSCWLAGIKARSNYSNWIYAAAKKLSNHSFLLSTKLPVFAIRPGRRNNVLAVGCGVIRMSDGDVCGFLSTPAEIQRHNLERHRRQLTTKRKYVQPEPETVVVVQQTGALTRARLLKDAACRVYNRSVNHRRRERCAAIKYTQYKCDRQVSECLSLNLFFLILRCGVLGLLVT